MTPKQVTESKQGVFSRSFLNGFAEALTSACGYKWLLSGLSDEFAPDAQEEPVRFGVAVEGDLNGTLVIEFRRQDAIIVASSMLQEEEGEYGEMESATLLELIQVAGERFRPERGASYRSLKFNVTGTAEELEKANVFAATISGEGGKRAVVAIHLAQELLDALAPDPFEQNEEEGMVSENVAVPVSARLRPEGINLDLVMDVELNVTLRFGKRQLSLREVLELNTGSVLELDRQVDEPVELLLDGVVIARGEAVVIDGNYGLRVTEVAQAVSTTMLHGSATKMQAARA